MSRPPRPLTLVRGLAPPAALACLALPFYGAPDPQPSEAGLTGFEMLSVAPTATPVHGPVAVAALVVCAAALAFVGLRRPSVLMVLVCLLSTVAATMLVVHHQNTLQAVFPGQSLPGYWMAVALLVAAVLASLAELLYTDVGDDFGDEDGDEPVRD